MCISVLSLNYNSSIQLVFIPYFRSLSLIHLHSIFLHTYMFVSLKYNKNIYIFTLQRCQERDWFIQRNVVQLFSLLTSYISCIHFLCVYVRIREHLYRLEWKECFIVQFQSGRKKHMIFMNSHKLIFIRMRWFSSSLILLLLQLWFSFLVHFHSYFDSMNKYFFWNFYYFFVK